MKKPNMMVLKSLAFFIFSAVLVKIDVTSSEQFRCTDSRRNVERGEAAVISCEYPMDFIAVFWYRGQEENPFLRLEEGRPTKESGFDINSSGDMIIENVEIAHGGTYRISVLDVNGVTSSATIDIYVKVSLKTGPQLESCSSSQHEICHGIDEKQKATILICYTTETRPEVNFAWSKLSSNGPINVDELQSNSSKNSSTGLFESWSIFRFDRNDFSLQYFTCSASGQAVMDERDTAIYVEGDQDVGKPTRRDTIIFQGETLQISCAEDSFQLMKWTFTFPNDTVRLVKEFYPGEEGGPCLFGLNCYVDDKGVLLFEATTYKNEGTYACIYSNGETTGKQITQVLVIIKPNPENIIIEGCTDINDCNENVALTGTLQASITGARPYVELKCEITEEAETRGFIFGDRNEEISHPKRGTFDTIYTAQYEIDECSKPVPVVCRIQGDTILNTLSPSHVNLVTDVSNCRRPGLIVFLVLLLIFLIATIVAFILYKRKIQKRFPRWLPGYKLTDEESNTAFHVQEQKREDPDEKRGEGEGMHAEEETKSVGESSEILETESVPDIQQFCNGLRATMKVPIELFEDLMKMFQEYDQTKPPSSLLVNQMVAHNCDNEMLSIVLTYLAHLTPNGWVPVLDFCKLLEELTLSNKLASGSSITIFVTLCKQKKINSTTYIDETGKLLKYGKLDEITIMTNLKDLLSKGVITHEEIVDGILMYVNSYKMNEKTALEEMKYLEKCENKIPFVMFLGAINKFYKSGRCDSVLLTLFDEILEEFLTTQSLSLVQHNVSNDNEAISSVYLQTLLCSTVDEKIPLQPAIAMLTSEIKSKEVLSSDFEKAYEEIFKNEKMTKELQSELSRKFLRLLKEVVPADDFEQKTLKMIYSKQFNEQMWIKFAVDLWKENAANEDLKSKLILEVANAYLMKRGDFKKPLDKMITYDERKIFMEPIKFDDKGIKKKQNLENKKVNTTK